MNDAQVAVPVSHAEIYLILICYITGYLIHVGLQVDSIARSEAHPINSRWLIVSQNGWRLAARFFFCLMGFWLLLSYPDVFPTVLTFLGITVSDNARAVMTMPLNAPIAGLSGLAIDTLLGFIPVLKNQLPPIEFTQVERTMTEKKVETTQKSAVNPLETSSAPHSTKTTEITVQEIINVPKTKNPEGQ